MTRINSVLVSAVLVVMTVVLATIGSVGTVGAQNGGSNGFVVSPVRSELTIEPGKSETVRLTVENVTNQQVTARAIVNDFEPSDKEDGQPRILLDEDKTASGNSFKILVGQIGSVTLAPREKKDIPVKISVAKGANAGGYYGAIRFVSDGSGSNDNVALAASVGTIFLVRVPGNLTESLDLVQFTAAKNGSNGRIFINSGAMSVVTRLKNNGNIHVKPYGKVQVADRSGKIIEEYEFNNVEPRANILPNSTRKFEDKLKNENWLGKYTVTANLGYGTGGNLITAKSTFWVIPAWFLVVLAVLIIGLIVGGYLIYRRFSLGSKHKARPRR